MPYEYICLKCGTKWYSSAEYEALRDKTCEYCHGPIYYSMRQIEAFPEDWKREALSKLEQLLDEVRK